VTMWGAIKATALEGMAAIVSAAAQNAPNFFGGADILAGQAAILRAQANNSRAGATARVDEIRANTDFNQMIADVWAQFSREQLESELAEAIANGGNAARIAELQEQLAGQAQDAENNALIDWWMRQLGPAGPGGGGGGGGRIASGIAPAGLSGFNAQLLFGAFGGSRTETDAQRQIRLQQQQIDRLDEQIRQQREIARVAGARWG
jgi:hypothetical protein